MLGKKVIFVKNLIFKTLVEMYLHHVQEINEGSVIERNVYYSTNNIF